MAELKNVSRLSWLLDLPAMLAIPDQPSVWSNEDAFRRVQQGRTINCSSLLRQAKVCFVLSQITQLAFSIATRYEVATCEEDWLNCYFVRTYSGKES